MVGVNMLGPALTARAVLPQLARVRGHLLLTGSVAGRVLRPGSLYSATKWAVTALAASIRAECVGTGVRVTLIQPGLTEAGPISPERQGDPKLAAEDVARAVLYAVSQPAGVDVSEIVIRPVGQDPFR
jgi:NADP-dependent 3-hydroxy acid dehydrogenase YdfG